MYLLAIFVVFLFRYTQAQDANCDFSQNVLADRTYVIKSPYYPASYTPGVQCRWIATCPNGYNCRLDCDDISLPESTSCSVDRLLISKSGDSQLASADYYCGVGTLTAVSTGQTISIGLITSRKSPGGRFRCYLSAQLASTPPSTCSCGYKKKTRIVGGEETKPNEFPMMAGIVYVDQRIIRCGAVITSKNYVVTAGHCVVGKGVDDIAVVVGEHDVSTGNETTATQAFRVASYLVHPQYNAASYDYDISIVRISGEIVFNDLVGPVCMPFKFQNWDFTDATVTILGWGTTSPGGPTSKRLRKVDVNVISQSTCQQSISTLTPRQMCTYARGKDACQDDSGGPLLYTDPTTGLLFFSGIVSYGKFCASESPGVNTRITALLDWIVQNAPADYCRK